MNAQPRQGTQQAQRNANINARLNRIELRLYTLINLLHHASNYITAESSFEQFKPYLKQAIQGARQIEFTNGNDENAMSRRRTDWLEARQGKVARQAAAPVAAGSHYTSNNRLEDPAFAALRRAHGR
jgi:hypothetical protein